jgi:transcriptional regulator with XRE-family HTH domain
MKMTSLAAFASQLRAWRQQMGWTQVEAADKLGYSASLVSGIETMGKTPTAEFAARCDTVFGTPAIFATIAGSLAVAAFRRSRTSGEAPA